MIASVVATCSTAVMTDSPTVPTASVEGTWSSDWGFEPPAFPESVSVTWPMASE